MQFFYTWEDAPIRSRPRSIRLFWAALSLSLIASAFAYFLITWRWPLVSDASVMHYLAFLIERGWAPYRQIVDQQFPGAPLLELAGMHLFGMSSLGWRLFDFTLLACATAAFFALTREAPAAGEAASNDNRSWTDWVPGLFAASLFILSHGRDGLAEGGQRDLTMAVVLLVATAFLFSAIGRGWVWCFAVFGLLSGLAFSIKPIALPIGVAQLLFACYVIHRKKGRWALHAIAATLAWLIAPAIAFGFLLREHALAAFISGFRGMVPYYASLGHRSIGYILVHSVSPILLLVILWLLLLALNAFRGRTRMPDARTWLKSSLDDWKRTVLLLGTICALLDCLLQARALPYYRYPLLAFLLPLMAIDFYRVIESRTAKSTLEERCTLGLALAALSFGGFILAPQSAVLIHRYRWWDTPFLASLEQNLQTLGGPTLSGHIQCIDSIAGCTTVLYQMRLEPVSGVLGDYVTFGPDALSIVQQSRQQLQHALAANPPWVIVVASGLFMGTADGFTKLDRWPAFESFLGSRYTLATQWSPDHTVRWWSREELPASYRIYVLRDRTRSPAQETTSR